MSEKTYSDGQIACYVILKSLLMPDHAVGIVAPSFRQSKNVCLEMDCIFKDNKILKAQLSSYQFRSDCLLYYFINGSSITAMPVGDTDKIKGQRFHTLFVCNYDKLDKSIADYILTSMINVRQDPMNRTAPEQRTAHDVTTLMKYFGLNPSCYSDEIIKILLNERIIKL